MVKFSKEASKQVIKESLCSLATLLLFIGWYVFYKLNIAPIISAELQVSLRKYIGTIFVICVGYLLQKIVGAFLGWYKDNITTQTKTQLDDKLIPLLRRSLKVVVWVIALLVILPFYGVNINALIATLGVGSLAIALAAQDTIAISLPVF